jgi:hypothetical protein
MGQRTQHGRQQLDRAGIAARTGAAPATVDYWYRQRAHTGFPAKADTGADGRNWWWLEDVDAFRIAHLAGREATFTRVDRRGQPNELITAPQAAKVLGYKDHRSLPRVLLDNPDRADELPSGRLRRRWYRRTVWAYADGRPLRHSTGHPVGIPGSVRKASPYADDPRLDAAGQLLNEVGDHRTVGLGAILARRLGIGERTGQRLIAAARQVEPEGRAHG